MADNLRIEDKAELNLAKPGPSKIKLKKRKTRFSNTYLNPDGSFSVEVSGKPVNFKNPSGNLQDIDNVIVSKAQGGYEYENLANSVTVRFAKNNMNDKLVHFAIDEEHWIAFSPVGHFTQVGNPQNVSFYYKDVKQNVDLEYVLDGYSLKENIILRPYPQTNSISYYISYGGVRLEKQADGSIAAIDVNNNEKLFTMNRPIAMDSKGDMTDQISLNIIKDVINEKLEITVLREWLENASYPVVIDPEIVVNVKYEDEQKTVVSNISDTFLSSGRPGANYLGSYPNIHAGRIDPDDYQIARSLIRFDYMPALPPGAKIESAYLSMYMWSGIENNSINVYRITSKWTETSVSWNNQPTYDSANPIVTNFVQAAKTYWDINITSDVVSWFTGVGTNNGFFIKATNENNPRLGFYSSNSSVSTPKITINYKVDALGVEPFFPYQANVNVHNGNLVLNAVDVTLSGRGVPIIVTRTYNSRSAVSTSVGDRWRLNFDMNIKYNNDGANPIQFVFMTDADGTTKMFTISDEIAGTNANASYNSPPGVLQKLMRSSGVFILEEKSGVKYYFGSDGYLDKIEDTNKNVTTLTYTSGKITNIKDASGRMVNFSYVNNKLDTITGNEITTMKYEYNGNYLQRVKKLDSSGNVLDEVIYGYDTNNNVSTVTDAEGKKIEYKYVFGEGAPGLRVGSINTTMTINEDTSPTLLTTSFSYSEANGSTTITYPRGNKTIYVMNSNGNVTSIDVAVGTSDAYKITYKWDEVNQLTEVISPKGYSSGYTTSDFTTEFEYDETGNLTRTTNPMGYSIIYKYSANDETEEIINALGTPTINTFNEARNVKVSSTAIFSTVALGYGSYGNVAWQTDPIGTSANLVQDSGFENIGLNAAVHWTKSTQHSGAFTLVTAEKVNGYYSARLASTGDAEAQRAVALSSAIPVTELIRYNVSWYVKASNAGSSYGGATIQIRWVDVNLNVISTTDPISPVIGNTKGFVRRGGRVGAPLGAVKAYVLLSLSGASSTAWFDNIQFEYIPAISRYNLLFNADFEMDNNMNNQPDGWAMKDLNNPPGILDTNEHYLNNRSYKIIGGTGYKYISQSRKIEGGAGIPFLFSCWTKATGTQNPAGGYSMTLQFLRYNAATKTNDIIGEHTHTIEKAATTTWQYEQAIVNSPGNFDSVALYCTIRDQTGLTVWFDNLKLRINASPAAVMSRYNLLNNGSFEYESNLNVNDFDDWVVSKDGIVPLNRFVSLRYDGEILPYSGDRMIKIYDVPEWATLINSIREPLDNYNNKTYTVSAMVKTVNVTGAGAVIKLNILSAAGYLGQLLSEPVTGTTDWSRVAFSVTTEEILASYPAATAFAVAIGTAAATTGAMYFDSARVSEGNEIVEFKYDTATQNYVEKVTDQAGNEILFSNDNRGNLKRITDARKFNYTIEYDKLDRVDYTITPNNIRTDYIFNKNSTIRQIDNSSIVSGAYLNTTVNTAYNEMNLPKVINEVNWKPTNLYYDKNANISKVSFPNGKSVQYTYDSADRLKQKTYSDNINQPLNFEYDANSNLIRVRRSTGIMAEYDYDSLDRMTDERITNGIGTQNAHGYAYNPNNQPIALVHSILPGANDQVKTTGYTYDLGDMLSGITSPNNTRASFMYDEESRLSKSYIAITGNSHTVYREFDVMNRISRLSIENRLAALIYDYSFAYDANGNRIEDIDNLGNKRAVYIYDEINQLKTEQYYTGTTVTRQYTYEYDELGNRKKRTSLSGTSNTYDYRYYSEIIQSGTDFQYTHDNNGNIIKAGAADFIYNAENQLIQFVYSGTVAASYEYDWRGLRTKKTVGTKTELYYYTGNDLSYITDGANKLKYYFVRDLNGTLLQMTDYTGTTPKSYIYVLDVHGSVIGLADDSESAGSTGVVVNYEYDAWGNLLNVPQTVLTGNGESLADASPFRYCGYQFDKETGFYYLKYRYYIPSLGRFLTRDPMMTGNRYVYCRNNPVQYVDSLGLMPIDEDKNGRTIQVFPNGNIRYRDTGELVGKLPYIKASDRYTITESQAYNANAVTDLSRTIIFAYATTAILEMPAVSSVLAGIFINPFALKSVYVLSPVVLDYFIEHPSSPFAPVNEIRAGDYSYTTYFSPYKGSTMYGTYTTVTEGVYGSYFTGTKSITLLPPEYTSRQERSKLLRNR